MALAGPQAAVTRRVAVAIRSVAAALMVVSFGAQGALAADPPTDRVLQADRYTSEKGRGLAQKYQGTLRDLNAKVYHCMPWLEVKKEGRRPSSAG